MLIYNSRGDLMSKNARPGHGRIGEMGNNTKQFFNPQNQMWVKMKHNQISGDKRTPFKYVRKPNNKK